MRSPLLLLGGALVAILLAAVAFLLLVGGGDAPDGSLGRARVAAMGDEGHASAQLREPCNDGDDGRSAASAEQRRAIQGVDSGGGSAEAGDEGDEASQGLSFELIGRLVDGERQGLGDVDLVLRSDGVWSAGEEVPALEGAEFASTERGTHGWRTRSDAEGHFAFRGPLPDAREVLLEVSPDPHRAYLRVSFGGPSLELRGPLSPGRTDLGEWVLAARGAVSGKVLDGTGAPIAGAIVTGTPWHPVTGHIRARSDEAGRYLLGHLPEGRRGLTAAREGFLRGDVQGLQIVAGRTLEGVDLVLAAAPVLAGRIVGEHGLGLEGARVEAWPAPPGGTVGMGTSGADGHFELPLHQVQEHSLHIAFEGYEDHGPRRYTADASLRPGTRGIEVALVPAPTTLFRVRDRDTGEPIERFRLVVDQRHSAGDLFVSRRTLPPPAEHPGGEMRAGARPGFDRVRLSAPAHLPLESTVEHDFDEPGVQTLLLQRGAVVTGRTLVADEPVAGVELRAEVLRTTLNDPWEALHTRSGPGGRFTLVGLPAGQYPLRMHGPHGLVGGLELKVEAGARIDLGDVLLGEPASVLAEVLLPAAVTHEGVQVELRMASWSAPPRRVDLGPDRRAAFRGLTPGTYSLSLPRTPDGAHAPPAVVFSLANGEQRSALLDATPEGRCEVTLEVRAGDRNLEGWRIALLPAEHTPGASSRDLLPPLDATGRTRGDVPARGRVRVHLGTPSGVSLPHPSHILELERGASVSARVDFPLAELDLTFPVPVPERWSLEMRLIPVGDVGTQMPLMRWVAGGGIPPQAADTMERIPPQRLVLGPFPVGHYRVEASLREWVTTEERDALTAPLPSPSRHTFDVEFVDGERARVILNP